MAQAKPSLFVSVSGFQLNSRRKTNAIQLGRYLIFVGSDLFEPALIQYLVKYKNKFLAC